MKLLRCAIYTRKSSEEGLEQDFNSLHAQREACEAYVVSQVGEGWKALKTHYDDGGVSGGTMDRPGLRALLADIAAGHVDVVVVYKVDRLTRSLMDFAKIVETFDRFEVSFVSVTQAFNTTSSMGRLTLNVLLSFAQFEREVTGERIRDKLAASKKKGLWMGGNLPLGYDPDGRTLKVNELEAAQVRDIFARYLVLKSVHHLAEDLRREEILSKRRMTKAGRSIGGGPMKRGALFHLLSNPVYVGQIRHKEQSFPGLHPAIIDQATFDAVQGLLAKQRVARPKTVERQVAFMLAGRIFDSDARPMSPTTTRGHNKQPYRYYVSAHLLRGGPATTKGIHRLPAPAFEAFVFELVGRITGEKADPAEILKRVDVALTEVTLVFKTGALSRSGEAATQALRRLSTLLRPAERIWTEKTGALCVALPLGLKFQRGRRVIEGAAPPQKPADRALVASLRRGHRIARDAGVSTIASTRAERLIPDTYSRRLAALAFLAPDIQQAILAGRAPRTLTSATLLKHQLPACWVAQRQLLGFASEVR